MAYSAYIASKFTLLRTHRRYSLEQFPPENKKFSKDEEMRIKDVLKLDSKSFAPSLSLAGDVADTISRARRGQGLGTKCLQWYIEKITALETRLGRTYEHQRRPWKD
jgi:hypothetical protein